jgi:diguanylate cyclase (GGDEF)-like protein
MIDRDEPAGRIPPHSRTEWRRRAAIIAFGVLAFVSYSGLVAFNLFHARARELVTAHERQASLAKVLDSHAQATLQKIDAALLSVQLQLSGKPESLRPEPARMNAILASHLALIDESQSLRVADASGHFIYDASGTLHPATIADRDYFRLSRVNPHGQLVISEPLFARITHNWVVTVSRRFDDENGNFAGLVQAAVRAEYFEHFYASLGLGPTHSVTLIDQKLRMLARYPAQTAHMGKPIDSALLRAFVASGDVENSYIARSAVDGIERHFVVHKIGRYPLYVILGHSTRGELAEWYRQLYWSIAGVFVLGAVLIGWIVVWLRSYDAALALARRMTSAYEATMQRIRYLAEHDPLTDLPNRALLEARMASTLAETIGRRADLALMFLDLDRFKDVNDTLGHAVGDKLLIQVSDRLRANLRAQDTVSRQGGDEFAILLHGYSSLTRVAEVAQALIDAMAPPFQVDKHELLISASIGISVYPQHGSDIVTLLKNADTAMYEAKAAGGGAFRFFSAQMNALVLKRVEMDMNLRHALANQEFVLHYQPQVEGGSGRILGVEALIRWHHPRQGDIPPTQFIPIAEESGLINNLGDWVLREACRQSRQWMDSGLPELTMAINISAVQLRQPDFIEKVVDVLDHYGLPPHRIELEITESALIRDTQRIVGVLHALQENGLRLSVDDFGTGYSSLGYLKHLPFDKIKIDQSFVRGLPQSEDDAAITQAIIGIASSLKMELIAEGVETEAQRDFLLGHACQHMQGYYFGKPMPAADIERMLRNGKAAEGDASVTADEGPPPR